MAVHPLSSTFDNYPHPIQVIDDATGVYDAATRAYSKSTAPRAIVGHVTHANRTQSESWGELKGDNGDIKEGRKMLITEAVFDRRSHVRIHVDDSGTYTEYTVEDVTHRHSHMAATYGWPTRIAYMLRERQHAP